MILRIAQPALPRRSGMVLLAAGLTAVIVALPARQASAFEYADVVSRAQALAKQPYQEPPDDLPKSLRALTYEQYQDIRFRPERSLWRAEGLPFEVQFFHRGYYFTHKVLINVLEADGIKPVPFNPEWFDYGQNHFGQTFSSDLGYAGLRLHYPVNRPDYRDEVVSFLGASYFRALGKGQVYGLSARGLAIDTAEPTGEEFPYFKEFWLRKPARNAKQTIVYALLDSRSATGAYQFIVRPGEATVIGVTGTLFLRKKVAKLGIAPLTSMFYYGENTVRDILPQRPTDYRPEVHDSDGLLIHAGSGEWIWRPLINPIRLKVNAFETSHPLGFGLMQRDRNFDHYQDLAAHFDRRPSAWVVTRGDWGDGHVELIQIPSDDERNDNITAFWVAKTPPSPGKAVQLSYDIVWTSNESAYPPAGHADATRSYLAADGKTRVFVLDFVGGQLTKLGPDKPPEVVVSASPNNAAVTGQRLERNTVTNGWRVVFQVPAKTDSPLELRAFLKKGRDVLTETWSYLGEP